MNNIKLFGDKQVFAIEVGETNNKSRFNLRFWVKNNSIGHFKRAGSLKRSFREFKRFIDNRDKFYLDIFDDLSPSDIYYYLFDVSLLSSETEDDFKEFSKRAEFHLVFGVQFSTDTSNVILLYKNDSVIFLLPHKKREGLIIKSVDVPFEYFYNVAQEYILFYQG